MTVSQRSGRWGGALMAFLVSVAIWGCDEGPTLGNNQDAPTVPADAEALQQALADARPGDTVMVEPGLVRGPLTIPAGVTLMGVGPEMTVLEVAAGPLEAADEPALSLSTEASLVTGLANIRIVSGSLAAVAATGGGTVRLEDVEIQAIRGVGLAASDLEELTLQRVRLAGPVTAANAGAIPPQPALSDVATHGLVALRVAALNAEELWTSGFASFGAVVIDSALRWTGGGATDNVGVGLMVEGGSAVLEGVELCGTLRGTGLLEPYSGVFSRTTVDTNDLRVCDGAGVGLLHDATTGSHVNLDAARNEATAVWIQSSESLALTGAATTLSDNGFAGVVVLESQDITIADALIESTRLGGRVVNDDVVEVGDGIQLVDSTVGIDILDVTLQGNSRVGLLAELRGGTTERIRFRGVEVSGEGEQLGVVAQGGDLGESWDDGVTRLDAVAENDQAFLEAARTLDVVGLVSPTDIPAAGQIAAQLLERVGIIAPSD